MAMDSEALGQALADFVKAQPSLPPSIAMIPNIDAFWKGIAAEIVKHIKENAEVPAGIPVSLTATTGPGKVV